MPSELAGEMPAQEARCGTCRYWRTKYVGGGEDDNWGECRRHAPRPIQAFHMKTANLLGSLTWLAEADANVPHKCPEYSFEGTAEFQVYEWPFTQDNDWCGEFAREASSG